MTEKQTISIVDWFQTDKIDHLEAWTHLDKHGCWPEGFLPENIEFSGAWEIEIMGKMAQAFVEDRLHAQEIFKHGADCRLSIGRVICSDQHDYIRIQLNDQISGSMIFEGAMKLANYAKCITGLSSVDIRGMHIASRRVGKTSEHKTVEITFLRYMGCGPKARQKIVQDTIAKYEVDGWIGRVEDAFNHHHHVQTKADNSVYKVTFHRYV